MFLVAIMKVLDLAMSPRILNKNTHPWETAPSVHEEFVKEVLRNISRSSIAWMKHHLSSTQRVPIMMASINLTNGIPQAVLSKTRKK